MSFVLAVTWVAKPGEEAAVERILRTMTPLTRAERGCVQYVAHRSSEEPGRFFLYEVCTHRAAFEAHLQAPHFLRFQARSTTVVSSGWC